MDQDGRQDAGEPGLSGIIVQLWNSTKTQLLDAAVTNASGIYTVTAPVPGDYRVRVLLPPGSGVAFTIKDAVGTEQTDSDINAAGINYGFSDMFTIASNVISTTIYDAGLTGFTPFTQHQPIPARRRSPIQRCRAARQPIHPRRRPVLRSCRIAKCSR